MVISRSALFHLEHFRTWPAIRLVLKVRLGLGLQRASHRLIDLVNGRSEVHYSWIFASLQWLCMMIMNVPNQFPSRAFKYIWKWQHLRNVVQIKSTILWMVPCSSQKNNTKAAAWAHGFRLSNISGRAQSPVRPSPRPGLARPKRARLGSAHGFKPGPAHH